MNANIKRLVVSNKLLRAAKALTHNAPAPHKGYCCNVLPRGNALRLFAEVYKPSPYTTAGWFTRWGSCGGNDKDAYDERQFALLFLRQAILNDMIPLDYKRQHE